MKRREFLRNAAVGSAALSTGPALVSTSENLFGAPNPSAALVPHCKKILKQNLLKEEETLVLATPYEYDREYMTALMVAAAQIGAVGAHVAILQHLHKPPPPSRIVADPRNGLRDWHYKMYATADLLITSSIGAPAGTPSPSTSYYIKIADHPYASDGDLINRSGSKTRWLQLGYPVHLQKKYMPNEDRKKRTLGGAMRLQDVTEIRITSDAGSDFKCNKAGRPGHAQYGIADFPGRWDNFGYGCVACMPNEDSAEGTLVLQPGDIIRDVHPTIITENVALTFEGGYVTKVEGGRTADAFRKELESFNHKEAWGLSHVGWGTHEKASIGGASRSEIGHYHHNETGSLLYSLGMNAQHGEGGPGTQYSGSGPSTRVAPNHSHYAMFGCNVYLDGDQIIDNQKLLI